MGSVNTGGVYLGTNALPSVETMGWWTPLLVTIAWIS